MEIWEIFRNLVTQCLPTLKTRRSPIPCSNPPSTNGWMLLLFTLNSVYSWLTSRWDPGIWEVSVVPGITFLAISVQGVFLGLCSNGEGICWSLTMALLLEAAF